MINNFKIIALLVVSLIFLQGCTPESDRSAVSDLSQYQIVYSSDGLTYAEATLAPAKLIALTSVVDDKAEKKSDSEQKPAEKVTAEEKPAEAKPKAEPAEEVKPASDSKPEPKAPKATEETPKPSLVEPAKDDDKAGVVKDVATEGAADAKPAEEAAEKKPPIFHEEYQHIFSTYVNEDGLVDYQKLRRKRARLFDLVRKFNDLSPMEYMAFSRDEKIAFWLNTYNTLTLKYIVDNYPIQPKKIFFIYPNNSIIHIPGARKKLYFDVMDQEYTLEEIGKLLVDKYKDPRLVVAICHGTLSSGPLRNEAYHPEKLDQQLNDQVKRYYTSSNGLVIDHKNRVLHLSSGFNSYQDIFIEKYGEVKKFRDQKPIIRSMLNFLVAHPDGLDVEYIKDGNYEFKFMKYNWLLNDQGNK